MNKLFFVGSGGVTDDVRIRTAAVEWAHQHGIAKFAPYSKVTDLDIDNFDNWVISRPIFKGPQLLIDILKFHKKQVIVDMDDDFATIPPLHPGYASIGPGNREAQIKLTSAIAKADVLTVTHTELGHRLLSRTGKSLPIVYIPNGWSARNSLWSSKTQRKPGTVTIGWAGTPTHREDFLLCKRAIEKYAKNDFTYVIIGGDEDIFWSLNVPIQRKHFFPNMPYEYYPWTLGHIDIWLAPLLDNEFNQAKSDIKLVEASVKMIPFIASKIHMYSNWEKSYGGGTIAETENEWLDALENYGTCIRKQEPILFNYRGAAAREEGKIIPFWEEAIKTGKTQ